MLCPFLGTTSVLSGSVLWGRHGQPTHCLQVADLTVQKGRKAAWAEVTWRKVFSLPGQPWLLYWWERWRHPCLGDCDGSPWPCESMSAAAGNSCAAQLLALTHTLCRDSLWQSLATYSSLQTQLKGSGTALWEGGHFDVRSVNWLNKSNHFYPVSRQLLGSVCQTGVVSKWGKKWGPTGNVDCHSN